MRTFQIAIIAFGVGFFVGLVVVPLAFMVGM